MNEPALIDFQNVSVMRGDNLVLDSLNLRIAVGEHVAILGPNGCGKSTLIKTLNRELYPLAKDGVVNRIFGRDRWHVYELRSLLGIVTSDLMQQCTQEFSFTGREIVLGGFFSSIGIWEYHEVTPAMRAKADEVLMQLEISHLADRPVDEMSSGEAHRVLIARALVHDPKALLLDEPSSSLDLFAQHELRRTMRKLAQSGIAIILVTHQLSDIIPEIERVILMRGGRIVEDGPKAEILTRERLGNLFGVPVDLAQRDGHYHLW